MYSVSLETLAYFFETASSSLENVTLDGMALGQPEEAAIWSSLLASMARHQWPRLQRFVVPFDECFKEQDREDLHVEKFVLGRTAVDPIAAKWQRMSSH